MRTSLSTTSITPSQSPQLLAQEELALWVRLRASGDLEAREKLLALHMPYTRVVAASYYAKRFHDEVEFAEYVQFAAVGLLEALERFDPGKGAQFRTFAARRMHGAILNGLERLTEKQQQISARERIRAERAQAAKEMATDRVAGTQLRDTEHLFKYVTDVGLGLALCWILDGTAMVEAPERAESIPFYQNVALRQMREKLMKAVDALPSQERMVVRCHYMQEMPFEQVASTMNVTRGRISQIHKQALLHLRAVIAEQSDFDVSF